MIHATADSPTTMEPLRRYDFIDGLRGIAILGVLAVHLSQYVVGGPGGLFRTGILREYLESGARGVQLFFIISAFTLFSSATRRFKTEPNPVRGFYIRRIFRILPLWWIAIFLHKFLIGGNALPSALMYFGFVRFMDGVEVFPYGWSIFVEETFYLMFPFIFAKIDGLPRSLRFVAQTSLLSIVWYHLAPKLGVPNTHEFIFLFPFSQWFSIAIGIALFQFLRQERVTCLVEDPRSAGLIDVFTAILLFSSLREGYMAATFSLVVLFIAASSTRTVFGRIARNPVLGLLGTYCYSIYLFQFLILSHLAPYRDSFFSALHLGHATADVRFFICAPIVAAICMAVGFMSWHGLERPFIKLGARLNSILDRNQSIRAAPRPDLA
jgi:peptidoglycan/LPS O-acetylase OafA/YrhL